MNNDKPLDLFKILKSIQGSAGNADFYMFLMSDLKEKIETHERNTLYWTNQVAFLHRTDDPMTGQIKSYQKLIRENKKAIGHYKKSIKFLQKSLKQVSKGDKP